MFLKKRYRPDFIIIGGVKCASSSLFRYLIEHPNILPGKRKEPSYFTNKGLIHSLVRLPEYLKNFPEKSAKFNAHLQWPQLDNNGKVHDVLIEKAKQKNLQYITGEATATYNFSANPTVIKTIFPKMKIIALVRNPTDRFISHYNMFIRFKNEGRAGYDLEDLVPFIKNEIFDFNKKKETRILHQGLYNLHMSKWKNTFGNSQFFLDESSLLLDKNNAIQLLNRLSTFLEIPPYNFEKAVLKKHNVSPITKEDKQARYLLDEFYKEHNLKFFKHFGINFND